MAAPVVGHSVNPFLFGTGSWVYGQLQGLSRWRAVVVCKRRENRETFPFEAVHSRDELALPARLYQRAAHKLSGYFPFQREALERADAKLLHSHFGSQGWKDLPLARALGVPSITSFYGADIWKLCRTELWRRRYEELFAEGAAFFVEGNAMREKVQSLGCPPEKIVVQHLGIDVGAEPFCERQSTDGTVRLLAAGRAVEKKGFDLAVRAFARAQRRVPALRLSLMLIAKSPGERQRVADLHALVEAEGLGEAVEFPASMPYDEYRAALRSYHVYLAPSRHASDGDAEGGAPVALIEMSASGMPIVASRHCDIPEVVQHERGGLLFPEGDLEAFVEALVSIGERTEEWSAMGRAGREHVAREYDSRQQVARLEELYDRIAAGELEELGTAAAGGS